MKLLFNMSDYPSHDMRQPERPKMVQARKRLYEIMAAFNPRPGPETDAAVFARSHLIDVAPDDRAVDAALATFANDLKKIGKVGAVALPEMSGAELKKARFLEIFTQGDSVDVNRNNEPYNKWPALCGTCRYADLRKVPEPFLVDKKRTSKLQQDIFGTFAGLLVVRPKALAILKSAIGDQIEFGEARVVEDKRSKIPEAEQLRRVRPKARIGAKLDVYDADKCAACGRVTQIAGKPSPQERESMSEEERYTGLGDRRPLVEYFQSDADLAMVGNFTGRIDGGRSGIWNLVMSGALFDHLKSSGLKGLTLDEKCGLFSAKGESPIDTRKRGFGAVTDGGKRDDAVAQGKKLVRKMKDVPWGHQEDGYIYFYLTTPEVMLLDPMAMTEGGPFTIKKFKPGLHRLPVGAIKSADGDENAVDVDSASIVIIDAAFFNDFAEAFDWDKSLGYHDGDWSYFQKVAEQIGNRFGFCSAPGIDSGDDFEGDGSYIIDPAKIKRVEK